MKSLKVFFVLGAAAVLSTISADGSPPAQRTGKGFWPFTGWLSASTNATGTLEVAKASGDGVGQVPPVNSSERRIWKFPKLGKLALMVKHKVETTTAPADLSFLDDLGGMADYLPDPKDEGASSSDESIRIADEESSNDGTTHESSSPGFVQRILSIVTFGMVGGHSEEPAAIVRTQPAAVDNENNSEGAVYLVPTYRQPEVPGAHVAYRQSVSGTAPDLIVTDSTGRQIVVPAIVVVAEEQLQDTESSQLAEVQSKPVNADKRQQIVDPMDEPTNQGSLNLREYQNGVPTKAFVEKTDKSIAANPLATFENGDATLAVQPSLPVNVNAKNIDGIPVTSPNSALAQPTGESADSEVSRPDSEHRDSDYVQAEKIEGTEEVIDEEGSKSIETLSPAVSIEQPVADVATTYSKMRNYGAGNAPR